MFLLDSKEVHYSRARPLGEYILGLADGEDYPPVRPDGAQASSGCELEERGVRT